MKVCLYFFSGTGNTEKIALCLKRAFGEDTVVYKMVYPFAAYPNPNDFDLIGVGYPIHAFNAPKVVNDFYKRFPKADKPKEYFIFKTSGEPLRFNDFSSRELIRSLKKKGYACIQEFHYIMPYNMVFRHSDSMAKKMWIYAQKMVDLNVRKILSGKVRTLRFRPFQGWYTVPFRVEWPFASANGRFFKVEEGKCVHCLRCVRSCPLKNIELKDGKITFGNRCALCMDCSFSCPQKAIVPGVFAGKWLINGQYRLEQLEKDGAIPIPSKSHEAHFNKAYDRYFAECDEALRAFPPQNP
ncbi:MAG: EFR1 family ferrodoxin [Bacilli bacterium]|jgi:flavodoxin/NAD-dependent dihydropyrimidine dehydrogenase PreA subunit|nr:EFR1 family ferrodoxin [Bacilli bacterium]